MANRLPLFEELPDGFHYGEEFVSVDEEQALLRTLAQVRFSNFEMRGAVARRRVAFFGESYSRAEAAPALPEFLLPLRARIAAWAGQPPEAFAMALVNEYPPGAPIGWHRDAPQYEDVAGVSLGSACRMKFRPYVSPGHAAAASVRAPRKATHELVLQPRSAYLMTGRSRRDYEHSIPPVSALRYSVTFRSLRRGPKPAR